MAMKPRALLIFLISLLFCGYNIEIFAEDAGSQHRIDGIIKRLNSEIFVTGKFKQIKRLNGLSYPLKAEGHFMFWQMQGLHLATDKPFVNAITVTTNSIIQWQADGTGRVLQDHSDIVQREINKTLLAFFSADIDLIQQRFNSDWSFENEEWALSLTPKLDLMKKSLQRVVIHGKRYMQDLTVTAGNGDETRIEFSEHAGYATPTKGQCIFFYLQAGDACNKYKVNSQ